MFNFSKKQQPEEPKRLTGPELIAKVDEFTSKGVHMRDTAIVCGYVKYKRNGEIVPSFTEFYDQFLIAKGVDLGLNSSIGKEGRKLSYRTDVRSNGNLIIGRAYTALMNLEPGDEFRIKLTKSGILLIPVGSAVDRINSAAFPDD